MPMVPMSGITRQIDELFIVHTRKKPRLNVLVERAMNMIRALPASLIAAKKNPSTGTVAIKGAARVIKDVVAELRLDPKRASQRALLDDRNVALLCTEQVALSTGKMEQLLAACKNMRSVLRLILLHDPARPKKIKTKKKKVVMITKTRRVNPLSRLTGRTRGTLVHKQLEQLIKLGMNWAAFHDLNQMYGAHPYASAHLIVRDLLTIRRAYVNQTPL